ncbi:ParB/RepB/Spo0J family partition protein [Alicyclobacillus sp. SO9]|nr:ParB/RepB/Spo0J family partition protein [Alicyclobacillus sp. SO9]
MSALIPELDVNEEDHIALIEVTDLRPNPYQPRRTFNEEKLQELADSIREQGIIQPLIVRRSAVKGYDIVAGERRYRAAQMTGLTSVPAVVRDLSDVQLMEVAVIENLQREDLNAIEIADAYANLLHKCNLTQEQLAQRVGQSRSHVANMLRLLQLPQGIRDHVSRGTLSMGHARALLAIAEEEQQQYLADRTVKGEYSVRELERLIYKQKDKPVSRETAKPPKQNPYLHYEEKFQQFLGTSVKIHRGKKRGKIEIEYFSDDDLDRIMDLLVQRTEQG